MTQITEHQLFVTCCYTTYLEDIDNSKIIEKALYNEKNTPGNHRSNKGGYQTLPIQHNETDENEVLKLFSKYIVPSAQKIADSWSLSKEMDNYCYWYNINRRYNYNDSHIHPHSYISGVYYAKVPSNSGMIKFDRAESECDRLWFQQQHIICSGHIPDNNRINTEHRFVPQEGMLVLFPGHLAHTVEQNLTEDDDDIRVSLSFNFF